MSAVTARGGIAIVILFSACFFPYQKENSRASIVPTASDVDGVKAGAAAVIRTVR
jgi:hypothetical protein